MKIDLRYSIASLYDILLPRTKTSDDDDWRALLTQDQKTEVEYYIELLDSARWHTYPSEYSNCSLRCIKRNTHKLTNDNMPHRLFFLVDSKYDRLILLTNKRVGSSEHTADAHLQTVDECIEKLRKNHQLELSEQRSTDWLIEFSPEAATPISEILPAADEEIQDVEHIVEVVREGTISRSKLTKVLQSMLLIQDWPTSYVVAMQRVMSLPSCHFHFELEKEKFILVTRFGKGKFYRTLLCSDMPVGKFLDKFIKTFNNEISFDFFSNSISCDPTSMIRGMSTICDDGPELITREMLKTSFEQTTELYLRGSLPLNLYVKFLVVLQSKNTFRLLDAQNLKTLTLEILKILAIVKKKTDQGLSISEQRDLAGSSHATESVCVSSSATPYNDPHFLGTAVNSLRSALDSLIPRLTYSRLEAILKYEADLIDARMLSDFLSKAEEVSFIENFRLSMLWLCANSSLAIEEKELALCLLHDSIDALDESDKIEFYRIVNSHENLLKDLSFKKYITNSDKKTPSRKENFVQPVKEHVKVRRKKENRKATLSDFKKFERKVRVFLRNPEKTIAKLKLLLEPFIINNELQFSNPDIKLYFENNFLKNYEKGFDISLIELLSRVGELSLLDTLCQYCLANDKKMLYEDNKRALIEASKMGKVRAMRLLIFKYHFDTNYEEPDKSTALINLFKQHHSRGLKTDLVYPAAKLLIFAGANVNQQDASGLTALSAAAGGKFTHKIVKLLLQHGANPNIVEQSKTGEQITVLDVALGRETRNKEVEKALLEHGSFLSSGPSPRRYSSSTEVSTFFIKDPKHKKELGKLKAFFIKQSLTFKKRNSDIQDFIRAVKEGEYPIDFVHNGTTVLASKIIANDIRAVKAILNELKPNLQARVCSPEYPEILVTYPHLCISNGESECLRMFVERGAPLDVFDSRGELPIHAAAQIGDINSIDVLLDSGADPLAPLESGTAMAHFCKFYENIEIFRYLVLRKHNKPIEDKWSLRLRQAAVAGDIGSFKTALANGADISSTTNDSLERNVLHLACLLKSSTCLNIIQYLLKGNFIDVVYSEDGKGETPLQLFNRNTKKWENQGIDMLLSRLTEVLTEVDQHFAVRSQKGM